MILDTCAILFLASGDRRLSEAARQQIAEANTVWFCSISTFEIALKWRDQKLDLPTKPEMWVRKVAARYALTEVPLDSSLCSAAARFHSRGVSSKTSRAGCVETRTYQ